MKPNITLMIKGTPMDAVLVLQKLGLLGVSSVPHGFTNDGGYHRFSLCTVPNSHLRTVQWWFADLGTPPYPPGTLLHFYESDPWEQYGARLRQPRETKTQE